MILVQIILISYRSPVLDQPDHRFQGPARLWRPARLPSPNSSINYEAKE